MNREEFDFWVEEHSRLRIEYAKAAEAYAKAIRAVEKLSKQYNHTIGGNPRQREKWKAQKALEVHCRDEMLAAVKLVADAARRRDESMRTENLRLEGAA